MNDLNSIMSQLVCSANGDISIVRKAIKHSLKKNMACGKYVVNLADVKKFISQWEKP